MVFSVLTTNAPAPNALISPAPRDKVLEIAQARDEERQKGQIWGPFHGIPIILKDSFVTASELGISTTAGSYAFIGAKASKNGAITQRLIDAGLIILGKANITEFAGMKMTRMMPGWSAHGGQTLSPYVGKIEGNEKILGHSAPGGSSTGSAVAVAAGFSPLAMATETIGSIDTTGLYTMTEFFDCPGPMAKSAADVRVLSEILLGRLFSSHQLGSWECLSVGFLDPKDWSMSPDFCTQFEGTAEQMVDEYEETVSTLRDGGYWDFKNVCIPRFIRSFGECSVESVADIVKFNKTAKRPFQLVTFVEQNDLEGAMNTVEEKGCIDEMKQDLRKAARDILDDLFDNEKINILAAPGDSPLCVHASAAGYPVATVPIGQLRYNSRPFGLCLVARADEEGALLRFMGAYEKIAKSRPVPKF
ncbi:hypothetical protein ABOM_009853 [Aspergillus bombycis]|uniref:Amidase domain-containing protein n=1 Tax=Aspergillus bombycis TaxID=109264 RepID=A0A1F7ZQ24_9EURO|nr:hypothetical protein ABOM_009853 [Aspergillus bombycis]OGM41145.1 hypothetical protein ABOM_009853 [Aspergillus bombycis]